jgi:NAD(P)H-flavin reductase
MSMPLPLVLDAQAPPGVMTPVRHRVTAKRQETHDTWTLELEPEGAPLAPFGPGQFAMIWSAGVGEVPISISADRGRPGQLAHTIRAVGSVTRTICAAEPGDRLGVRGPFGTKWPIEEREGADVLVVAGGIGLAPLRPVIHHVLAHAGRYARLAVLYGARQPADLLYTDELESWGDRPDVDVAVTVDAAGRDWTGPVGVVTKLIERTDFDPGNTVAMVVGPEVMMRFTVEALREHGVAASDIYISMERNMQCAVGHCGHCQLGEFFICKDGPVFRHDLIERWLAIREL